MSEKRFIVRNSNTVSTNYTSERVYDKKNKMELYNSDIVTLLNQLNDENEQLKQRNKYNLEDCIMEIGELREENEQLKKELHIEQTDCKNAKESRDYWRNKAKECGG